MCSERMQFKGEKSIAHQPTPLFRIHFASSLRTIGRDETFARREITERSDNRINQSYD